MNSKNKEVHGSTIKDLLSNGNEKVKASTKETQQVLSKKDEFRYILPEETKFIVLFQSRKPMILVLYDEQQAVIKTFFGVLCEA